MKASRVPDLVSLHWLSQRRYRAMETRFLKEQPQSNGENKPTQSHWLFSAESLPFLILLLLSLISIACRLVLLLR